MRNLGLIGGMSWESTAIYYRALNEGVKAALGGLHSAKLVVWSFDFDEIAALQAAGDWAAATARMVQAALALKNAGAERLLIATNTMHMMAGEVEQACGLPVIHIADSTAGPIKAAGLRTVGLLATRFTMEQDFYVGRMAEHHGITALVPDAAGREVVHGIIYDELCKGVVREESRQACVREIDALVARGAQGIILGCTEVCMLIGQKDTQVPVFDSTALHVQAAVEWMVE